jgi:hypothetical protein
MKPNKAEVLIVSERLSQVRVIFGQAAEIVSAADRRAFLDSACGADADLRAQVDVLLKAYADAGSFLDHPVLPAGALGDSGPTGAFEAKPATPGSATEAELDAPLDEDLAFLSPPATTGALGRLAHYDVKSIIGKGGFGVVLKAFDERLHRMVAIKVLAPAYAANGMARNRFIREARAAAAVKNEHVVGIYDVQEAAQPPFLVMELIDGVSLQDKLDRYGTLGVKEILRIGMQIAEGLSAAHKQGLVHRDIKPANILLDNGVERVKITDFGLARAVDDVSVTQSGSVLGTPMYMSPEQAEGLPVDHRSDLFSLGTVLYAMCTGSSPFRGSNTHAVLKRVIDAAPRPIREINNEIPDWLGRIIAKLHAKKPADRFASAKDVAELLGERLADVQAGRPVTVPADGGLLSSGEQVLQFGIDSARNTALRQVYTPAVGLFITGLLYWLTVPFVFLTRYIHGIPEEQFPFLWRTMGVVPAVAGFVLMFGAAKMKRCESYGFSLFTAAFPLVLLAEKLVNVALGQFIMVLGDWPALPFGLWALLTLSRPDVRAAFNSHAPALARVAASLQWMRLFLVALAFVPFVLALTLLPKNVSAPEPKVMVPPAVVAASLAQELQDGWAKRAGVPVEITNSIGMPLRLIPPKESSEVIDKPYYLGATEVTVAQFRRFVEDVKYVTTAEQKKGGMRVQGAKGSDQHADYIWKNPEFARSDEHPVTFVTWQDAMAFCDWLSQKEKATYRLPMSYEWRWAARALSSTRFYFGESSSDLGPHSWHSSNAQGHSHPVRLKERHPWGLHDIYGNLWELSYDWQRGNSRVDPFQDKAGPVAGDKILFLGGSFNGSPEAVDQTGNGPALLPYSHTGFRVFRSASAEPAAK